MSKARSERIGLLLSIAKYSIGMGRVTRVVISRQVALPLSHGVKKRISYYCARKKARSEVLHGS